MTDDSTTRTLTTDDPTTPDRTVQATPDPAFQATPPAAAPNPSRRRRRGLALAGIIAGGILALALAFGGGMALGWALGAASVSSVPGDRPGQGEFPGAPGDRGQGGQLRPGQNGGTEDGSSS